MMRWNGHINTHKAVKCGRKISEDMRSGDLREREREREIALGDI